jgi:PAS domain S-box-containing protein
MRRLPSQLNSKTRRVEAETELIVWVRGGRNEMQDHGELNFRLHDFATELLKRGLIAKVQFLQETQFSGSATVDANRAPIHSKVTNWKLLANAFDAIVIAKGKVSKFSERFFTRLQQAKVLLRRALETLTTVARSVAQKPRRLREAFRGRENKLRTLLATSFDAIVVTNDRHRFVNANSRALELFGISERNITMFTMDAFFRHRQSAKFDHNDALVVNRKERHGECEIKRLDGSFLRAEYSFVGNVLPHRNLYRFREAAQRRLMPISHSQRHWAMN